MIKHGKITLQSKTLEPGFPGRWAGGITLVLAPLLLLAGILLRSPYNFFFPDQLAAYKIHPNLITASYSLYSAGIVLLWPAVITLALKISLSRPYWALWGGLFTLFGLFTRTFHAGVDHLAFQLVRTEGLDHAVQMVGDSYGSFHIFSTFNVAILLGWIILAIGSYRSGTLGRLGAIALCLMSALPLGVLKGTTPWSIAASAGLAAAFIPLGWKVLRSGPTPGWKKVVFWFLVVPAVISLFFIFGRLG